MGVGEEGGERLSKNPRKINKPETIKNKSLETHAGNRSRNGPNSKHKHNLENGVIPCIFGLTLGNVWL